MGEEVALATSTAFVLTFMLTPLVIGQLRRRALLDQPNHRSSHDLPTPRGAGAAVGAGTIAATMAATLTNGSGDAALWSLVAVGACFAAVGAADDLSPRSATFRLVAQLGLAIAGAMTLARVDGVLHGFAALAGIAAIVVYVNAFNFMDGINGISGAQAAVVGTALAVLGARHDDALIVVGGAAVAAAAVGFLPFNFPTARVFLGDVGSYFIGAWLAMLAVRALAVGVHPVAVALPFAVYLADTGLTLLRRAERGEPLFEAHRDHAYQRLVRAGWTHFRTTVWVTAITGLCAIAAVTVDRSTERSALGGILAGLGAAIAVGIYLAAPSNLRQAPASPPTET